MRRIKIHDAGYAVNGATAITWRVPEEIDVLLLGLTVVIITDATVANRYFRARARGPSGLMDLAAISTTTAHTASLTMVHVMTGGHQGTAAGAIGGYYTSDFPTPGLYIPAGGWFQWAPAASNQTGDAIGPLILYWVPAWT